MTLRETWVQFQVVSYQRLLKWYLIPPCLTLTNVRYISRVKWSNPGKRVAPSPTPQCSSYWKGSLLDALNYGRQLYFLLLPNWLIGSLIAKLFWRFVIDNEKGGEISHDISLKSPIIQKFSTDLTLEEQIRIYKTKKSILDCPSGPVAQRIEALSLCSSRCQMSIVSR